jgi:hypothetical protein
MMDDKAYHSRSSSGFGFVPIYDSDGGAASSTGTADGDNVTWATHPATVDELFQQQQFDFATPDLPGLDGTLCDWPSLEVSSDWTNPEVSPNLFAGLSDPSAYPFSGIMSSAEDSAAFPSAAGVLQSATLANNVGEQPMLTPAAPQAMSNEELDQDALLRRLRDAGYGYAAISAAMRAQLGIEITANALVKRYQKMPKTSEALLAKAIGNIMPQIMEQLALELPHIDDGTLSDEEQKMVYRMLQELPQILPNCVRGSLSRKRRSMQPSASL